MTHPAEPTPTEAPVEEVAPEATVPESVAHEAAGLMSVDDAIEAALAAEATEEEAPGDVVEAAPQVDAPAAEEEAEAPPEVVPPEEAPVSRALQKLVDQERALQAQRQALSGERQELEKLREYEAYVTMAAEKDVLGALEKMGFDPETVADAIIEGRGAAPGRGVQTETDRQIAELREQLNTQQKATENAQHAQMVSAARVEARTELSSNELLSGLGDTAVDSVLEVFQTHYNKTGTAPTYAQAIEQVETEFRGFLTELAQNEAVRKFLLSETAPVQETKPAPATPQARPSPTLTNRAAATVTKRSTEPEAPLYDGDRDKLIEAAIAATA